MQQEIRLASFNVRNLAPPGVIYYENAPPYSKKEYALKTAWIAAQLDQSNADIIGMQEVFSPQALADVLGKTRHYRDARYITVESDELPESPNVALVSRLPVEGSPVFHERLPDALEIPLPGDRTVVDRFSRPILHAIVRIAGGQRLHILLAHLKSKRPDYPEAHGLTSQLMAGLGILRSEIRRGADALGIHQLAVHLREKDPAPLAVMGDLNDFAFAVSTQILTGTWQDEHAHSPHRLFNCFEIQPGISRDDRTSIFFKGTDIPRIDHILVSEEFTVHTGFRLGRVSAMRHFISHLGKDRPELSDHGLVMATLTLRQAQPPLG